MKPTDEHEAYHQCSPEVLHDNLRGILKSDNVPKLAGFNRESRSLPKMVKPAHQVPYKTLEGNTINILLNNISNSDVNALEVAS